MATPSVFRPIHTADPSANHQQALIEVPKAIPLSSLSDRQKEAADLANDILLFSRHGSQASSPVPTEEHVAAHDLSESIQQLTLHTSSEQIRTDIDDLRAMISNHNLPIDSRRLKAFQDTTAKVKDHIKVIEDQSCSSAIDLPDPVTLESCKKFVAIIDTNLSIIDRNIQRLIHTKERPPIMYFPKDFGRVAYLASTQPVIPPSHNNTSKGTFGAVSIVRHKGDQELTYAIKNPLNAEDLRSSLFPEARDLTPAEQQHLEALARKHILEIAQEVDKLYNIPLDPGIMQFYGTTTEGYPMLEPITGRELLDAINDLSLTPCEQFLIAKKTATALAHAHAHPMIHGDLKPENIMLTADGEPKIIDFGFSRERFTYATDRELFGTIEYLAPEMANPDIVHKGEGIDTWSYGCILFAMLSADSFSTSMQFYDALYFQCYKKDYEYKWTAEALWDFLNLENKRKKIDKRIAETINLLGVRNESLSPVQKAKLISVLKACLVFDPKKRASMAEVVDIFNRPLFVPLYKL
jgi:hypothetical protein